MPTTTAFGMKLLAAKSFQTVRVSSSMFLLNNLFVFLRRTFNGSEMENIVGTSLKIENKREFCRVFVFFEKTNADNT